MDSSERAPAFFRIAPGPHGSTFDTEFLPTEDASYGKAPTCEVCGEILDSREWLPPYTIELTLHGSEWGDLAFFSESRFVMSERAVNAFLNEGLSGLGDCAAVTVARRKGGRGKPPPQYFRVKISRSTAAVDDARSIVARTHPVTCSTCRGSGIDAVHGFAIEAGTWSGEDVFVARGLPGSVVVSERFRRFAQEHMLTNLTLTPIERYVSDAMRIFDPEWLTSHPRPGREELRSYLLGRYARPDLGAYGKIRLDAWRKAENKGAG